MGKAPTEPPQRPRPIYESAYIVVENPAILGEFYRSAFHTKLRLTKRQIARIDVPLEELIAKVVKAGGIREFLESVGAEGIGHAP